MVIRMRVAACVLGLGLALPTRAAAPERELSLAEVLQFADENAPEISVAGRRVGVAEADVVAASPWMPADPSLDVLGGGRVGGGQNGADFGVGLSQTVEIFGERSLRREAAERTVDAARVEVGRARFNVHQAVHRSFQNALLAEAEVKAADDAVVFATRLVQVAEARVSAGDASSLTVSLARTALARAREQALTAQESQTAARLALGREAGFTDATRVTPRGELTTPTALPPLDTLAALAEAKQPRLAALRAEVEAAKARSALAEREGMPKPTFGLGYSVEGAALGPEAQTQHIGQATLGLPLPLFRGNRAEQARTAAQQLLIEAELAGALRLLSGQIAEDWTRAEAARARVLLFNTEILPGINDTLQQLEMAFSLGELDLTEVMVGREQVLAARREALIAWRTWFEASSALEGELGTELPTTTGSSASSPDNSTPRGTP